MSRNISLAAYSIRIRGHHTQEYIPFNKFDGTKDFEEFISDYIKSTDVPENDTAAQRLFRIDVQKTQLRNRVLEGYIETGEYGYESEFVDQAGKKKFKRESNMAEMLPFYFSLWMPSNKTTGILILQRFGQYGTSEAFKRSLTKYLRSTNQKVGIEISQVITAKAIKKILERSTVKKVTFRKYQLPTDLAKYFDKGELNERIGYADLSITAGRNHDLPVKNWVSKILGDKEIDFLVEEKIDPGKKKKQQQQQQKNKSNSGAIKSGNIGQNPDQVKVEFSLGNSTRTLDLHNLNIFRTYFDITDSLIFEKNGHPNIKSLQSEVSSLRKELVKLLYPNQNV